MGRRLLWLALGWLALGLGAIGLVLPLMPTTVFVLLAAFAFGKSSPEMRRRLVTHRRFGPAIRDWEERGAIRPRHKAWACLLMGISFLLAVLLALPLAALTIQGTILLALSAWLLTRPSA